MRLLITGGSGVLGRAFLPLAEADGHQVRAPGHAELDLFDPVAVTEAVRGVDAVLHLAAATGRPSAAIYQHALATGFSRGFEMAAAILLLGLLVAIAAIRVRRADLDGM